MQKQIEAFKISLEKSDIQKIRNACKNLCLRWRHQQTPEIPKGDLVS